MKAGSGGLAGDAEKLVLGFSYSMMSTVFSSVFLYIAGLVVMRLLGPSDYGLYQLIFMVPSLLAPLLNLGLEMTMVRYVSRLAVSDPGRGIQISRYLFAARVAISAAACLVLLVLAPWISRALDVSSTLGVRIASMFLLANMIYIFIQALFQAYFFMRERAIMIVFYGVTYLGIVLPLIHYGFEFLAPILAFTLAAILAVLLGLVLALRKGLGVVGLPRSEGVSLREHSRFAAPVYLANLMMMFFPWIGVILIRFSGLDVAFVGYFRGAYTILSLGSFVAVSLNVVVMPYVSEIESKGDRARLAFFCTKVTKLLIVLGIPAAVGFFMVSEDILRALLPAYVQAAGIMRMLSLFLLLLPIFAVSNTILTAAGRPRIVTHSSALICLGALLAGLPLALAHGMEGIALAYVISLSIGLAYSLTMMTRITGSSVELLSSAKAVAASAAMALVVYLVSGSISGDLIRLVATVVVGAASYGGIAFLLGVLGEDDLDILRSAIQIAKRKGGYANLLGQQE